MIETNEQQTRIPDQIGGKQPIGLDHIGELVEPEVENQRPAEQSPEDHGDGTISRRKERGSAY